MSEQPAKLNFVVYQGSAFNHPFQITEDDEVTPIDISDYSFKMQVRTAPGASGEPLVELENDDGVVMDEAEDGWFTLFISAPDTAALTPGEYVYDLDVVPGTGQEDNAYKALVGRFTIKPEVTV